jgi:intein-encoded DNA endonuclease-like protein
MSRGRPSVEMDYSQYAQFTYSPYGFGEFDEDDDEIALQKIRPLAKNRYTPTQIAKQLNLTSDYVKTLMQKNNIKWRDSK